MFSQKSNNKNHKKYINAIVFMLFVLLTTSSVMTVFAGSNDSKIESAIDSSSDNNSSNILSSNKTKNENGNYTDENGNVFINSDKNNSDSNNNNSDNKSDDSKPVITDYKTVTAFAGFEDGYQTINIPYEDYFSEKEQKKAKEDPEYIADAIYAEGMLPSFLSGYVEGSDDIEKSIPVKWSLVDGSESEGKKIYKAEIDNSLSINNTGYKMTDNDSVIMPKVEVNIIPKESFFSKLKKRTFNFLNIASYNDNGDKEGWSSDNGEDLSYVYSNGIKAKSGISYINGEWYSFDEDGLTNEESTFSNYNGEDNDNSANEREINKVLNKSRKVKSKTMTASLKDDLKNSLSKFNPFSISVASIGSASEPCTDWTQLRNAIEAKSAGYIYAKGTINMDSSVENANGNTSAQCTDIDNANGAIWICSLKGQNLNLVSTGKTIVSKQGIIGVWGNEGQGTFTVTNNCQDTDNSCGVFCAKVGGLIVSNVKFTGNTNAFWDVHQEKGELHVYKCTFSNERCIGCIPSEDSRHIKVWQSNFSGAKSTGSVAIHVNMRWGKSNNIDIKNNNITNYQDAIQIDGSECDAAGQSVSPNAFSVYTTGNTINNCAMGIKAYYPKNKVAVETHINDNKVYGANESIELTNNKNTTIDGLTSDKYGSNSYNNYGVIVVNSPKVNILNSTIKNGMADGVSVRNNSIVNFNSGTKATEITGYDRSRGDEAFALTSEGGCTVNINSINIHDNKSSQGTVRIYQNGTVNMYNGIIQNNNGAVFGGAVSNNGTFNLVNGTIKNNTCDHNDTKCGIWQSGTMIMSGNAIVDASNDVMIAGGDHPIRVDSALSNSNVARVKPYGYYADNVYKAMARANYSGANADTILSKFTLVPQDPYCLASGVSIHNFHNDTKTSDCVIYAYFTVTYHSNYSGGPADVPQGSIGYDTEWTAKDYSIFTRKGYTLTRWNTEANGTGVGVDANSKQYKIHNDTHLYAQWTPNKYTNYLYYNANGGTGAPATQSKGVTYPNTSCTFTVSSTEPTRSGYKFAGWYDAANGGNKVNAGSNVTVGSNNHTGDQSKTLYAHWIGNGCTNYLYYDANGGTGAPATQSKGVTFPNTSCTFTVSSTEPTRAGYKFAGWYDAANGGNKVNAGSNVTVGSNNHTGDQSKTLYAHWIGNGCTNYLYYDANGGTGAPATQSKGVTFPNTSCTFTVSSTEPTRAGYKFAGWYDAANGGNKVNAGSNVTVGSNNHTGDQSKTLYAQWTPNKYTNYLYYNANGGSGAPATQSKGVTYPNTSCTFTVSSTEPTRAGYKFAGWYDAANGGNKINAGSNVTVGSNNHTGDQSKTLYAHWNSVYYLDLNGILDGKSEGSLGSFGTADVYINGTLISNDCADFYNAYPTGTKYEIKDIKSSTGHYYAGCDQSLSGTIGTSNVGISLKLNTMKITVNFYRNQNSSDDTKDSRTYTWGVDGQKFVDFGWTKTGYSALGYNETRSATSKQYELTNGISNDWIISKFNANNSHSVNLYEIWKAKKYTFTITGDGGIESVTGSGTYDYGTVVKSTIKVKTGYHIVNTSGTTADGSGTHTWTNLAGKEGTQTENWTINGNRTIKVNSAPNTYTVTYEGNGNTSGSMSASTATYNADFMTRKNAFVKNGYKFNGWKQKDDGTNWSLTSPGVYESGKSWKWTYTKNITLVAQWTPLYYHIDLNGILDGVYGGSLGSFGTADVYINGSLVANDVTDYYTAWPYGTKYEIKDIKPSTGHYYAGCDQSLSGTLGAGDLGINLKLNTKKITVNFYRNIDNSDGTVQSKTYTWGVDGQKFVDFGWTKTGYSALGYNETRSATSKQYELTNGISNDWINSKFDANSSHSVNLYEIWHINKYRIDVTGDSGVESISGNGSYNYGTSVTLTYKIKNGYHITSVTGDKADGTQGTWTNLAGKEGTQTDTWTIVNFNRKGVVHTAPNTYNNSICLLAGGFKNGEGNHSSKSWYYYSYKYFNKNYGDTINITTSDCPELPKGFYLNSSQGFGSGSFANSWTGYTFPKSFTQPAKDVYFEFYALPNTYNITYNMNGGTNNGSNPSSYNILYGVKFANPTRTGYTFDGWTDENGKAITGINEGANATFSSPNDMKAKLNSRTIGNRTITANWRANSYTVTIHPNSGSINVGDNNITKTSDGCAKFTVTYGSSSFYALGVSGSKTGYTATGIFDKTSGGTKVWNNGGNCLKDGKYWNNSNQWCYAGNVDLYFQWTPNHYKLTLNPNNGKFNSDNSTAAKTLSPDLIYDSGNWNNISSHSVSRTGYTFQGWYTAPSGGTKVYNTNGSCTNDGTYFVNNVYHHTGNLIVYAHWTPNTYTVTYDSNKPKNASTNVTGSTASNKATYDSNFVTTKNGYSLVGWRFNGWNEKPDGSGTAWTLTSNGVYEYENGKHPWKWTYDKNVTLYAQWVPNTYTVTYDSNKPVKASGSITGSTSNSSHTYDVSKALTMNGYKLTGWTFTGWNDKKDGSGNSYSNGQTVKNLTATHKGTVTLYAQWRQNTYTIIYDKNKPGKASHDVQGTMPNSSHPYDDYKKLDKNTYTLTGWTFTGWNTKPDGSGTKYSDGQSIRNFTDKDKGTFTLYAQWKQNRYTVTFHKNHRDVTGTMNVQWFTYDEQQKLSKNQFVLKGYRFDHWNTKSNNSGTSYNDQATILNLTPVDGGNIDFYAQWKLNITISMTVEDEIYHVNDTVTPSDIRESIKPKIVDKATGEDITYIFNPDVTRDPLTNIVTKEIINDEGTKQDVTKNLITNKEDHYKVTYVFTITDTGITEKSTQTQKLTVIKDIEDIEQNKPKDPDPTTPIPTITPDPGKTDPMVPDGIDPSDGSQYNVTNDIRYISKKYLPSLNKNSKWRTNSDLFNELKTSVSKKATDDNAIYIIEFNKDECDEMKQWLVDGKVWNEDLNKQFLNEFGSKIIKKQP